MGMLAALSAIALLFAATGVYGVVALTVNMRRAEFATRVVFGAQLHDIARMVLGHAFKLLAVGLLVGVAAGLLAATAMRQLLYGVTPLDPVNLLAVLAVLTGVTAAASLGPAWRATRVDVMQTLRTQ